MDMEPRRGAAGALYRRVAALPLRWRLALGYALVLLLVLAPLAALQAVAVHDQLVSDARANLLASTKAKALAAGRNPLKGPPGESATTAARQLATSASGTNLAAIVVDKDGDVLGASPDDAGSLAARLDVAAHLQGALNASNRAVAYEASTSRGPVLVALAGLPSPDLPQPKNGRHGKASPPPPPNGPPDPTGALVLVESLQPIAATTQHVWALTLAGAALALLVAAALGALLVRGALRPLVRVAIAAQGIAHGDYARRVAAPTAHDEVGHLAASFNAMAAAVEESFATQRRFVADAAHELRTPLTAVRGYADVLLLGAASDPRERTAALEALRDESRRMARLVDDLLALARLDADGAALRDAPVDLAALARETVAPERLLHPDRAIVVDAPPAPVVVRGDPDRLRQVVGNLLDNALKFTDSGGHIGLLVRVEGPTARIEVRDDGVGIAPDEQRRVFERFYRADRARGRATGGTGLGLSIVQAIVAAHGGTIALSGAPGQGTAVTIFLPLAGASSIRANPA